jgi:hypothetical protein
MTNVIPDPLDQLNKSLCYTARSRFNAAKRLEKRDRSIGWVVSMASAYTIIVAVLPYLVKLPPNAADLLNLVVIAFSIVTLVSSLLVASRRDSVNAEQHHRSGLELNEVRRKLTTERYEAATNNKSISKAKRLEFQKMYDDVLQKYSVNHEEIDFKRQQLEWSHELSWLTSFEKAKIWIYLKVADNVISIVMFGLTCFFIWLVFFYALPLRLG